MTNACTRFWSPFNGFTQAEVGTSFWIPDSALTFSRLLSGIALLVVSSSDLDERPKLRFSSSVLASIFSGTAFLLLAAATNLKLESKKTSYVLRNAAGLLHQIGASLSLYAFVVLIGRVAAPLRSINNPKLLLLTMFILGKGRFQDALPLCLVFLDFVLGSKIRFRITFVWVPVLILGIQIWAHISYLRKKVRLFARLAFVIYHFPAFLKKRGSAFEGLVATLHVICAACALAVIMLSRISMFFCSAEDYGDIIPREIYEEDQRKADLEDGRATILFEAQK